MNTRRIMALKEAIHRSGQEHMDDNMATADGIVETATAIIMRQHDMLIVYGNKEARSF